MTAAPQQGDEQPGTPSRRAVVTGITGGLSLGALALSGCDATGGPTGTASPVTTGTTTPASPSREPAPTTSTGGSVTPGDAGVLATDGPDITRGPHGKGVVALTFHGAGDIGLTKDVLKLMETAGAHFTVFAVGQWLAANLDIGRAIVAAGHDLGNHTWSHQTMPRLSATDAGQEIALGAKAVASAIGSPGLLFRPSGTQTSTDVIRAAARNAGYHRCISYDVDPEDYADPGRDAVVARTLKAVGDGSIVSLHLGHQGTVDALPAILTDLQGRGLQPVTLSAMLR